MRIARLAQLDALCGEYMIGTLRGAARRRFETALDQEPAVSQRLTHWQNVFLREDRGGPEVTPSPKVWLAITRQLGLPATSTAMGWTIPARPPGAQASDIPPTDSTPRRTRWAGARWPGIAAALAALVLIVVGVGVWLDPALLPGNVAPVIVAHRDAREVTVALASEPSRTWHADLSVEAAPNQTYQLWLVPASGKPQSLGVVNDFNGQVALADDVKRQIDAGAKLAVSIEPAGGSPTGGPTGPVAVFSAA